MSKEAYYFSHDSNARNDDKVLALRMKHGWEGYGLFWALIEKIRDSKDFMCVKDYNIIAFDLRTDASKIKSIIEDFGLFVFTDCGKYLYSESLLKRMGKRESLSAKRRAAINKRWNKVENQEDSTSSIQTDTKGIQTDTNGIQTDTRKGKEKKGKESKGKETHTQDAGVCEELPNPDLKNPETEEKEKSSAKKEKEAQEIKDSNFFKQLCNFFSQTTEVMQMQAFGNLMRLYDAGKLQAFTTQAQAYMAYKTLTKERVHRFNNFISEWENEDWVNKLKKERDGTEKQPEAKFNLNR